MLTGQNQEGLDIVHVLTLRNLIVIQGIPLCVCVCVYVCVCVCVHVCSCAGMYVHIEYVCETQK